MNEKTRKLTLMAMLSALAYLLTMVCRISVVAAAPFLNYDPKDIIIAIGAFSMGPGAGALITLLVGFLEMIIVGDTGFIGFFMNVLSSCAFACPAAWYYRRNHTLRGAAIGLGAGVLLMTAAMLAWNYIVTPIYMGYPREAVAAMLVPVFLPFNLLKAGLNAGLTMLVYKPVSATLHKTKLLSEAKSGGNSGKRRVSVTATLLSLFVVATCVLCFWFLKRG